MPKTKIKIDKNGRLYARTNGSVYRPEEALHEYHHPRRTLVTQLKAGDEVTISHVSQSPFARLKMESGNAEMWGNHGCYLRQSVELCWAPAPPRAAPGQNAKPVDPADSFVIGVLYETPDGRIARTFSWSGRTGMVGYYFDDGEGERKAPEAECLTWKRRSDLNDFPNARDPRLPYVFDLLWDIKHMSGLRRILKEGHEDEAEIRELMVDHNIQLEGGPKPPRP